MRFLARFYDRQRIGQLLIHFLCVVVYMHGMKSISTRLPGNRCPFCDRVATVSPNLIKKGRVFQCTVVEGNGQKWKGWTHRECWDNADDFEEMA
jgi:hypothetical protein